MPGTTFVPTCSEPLRTQASRGRCTRFEGKEEVQLVCYMCVSLQRAERVDQRQPLPLASSTINRVVGAGLRLLTPLNSELTMHLATLTFNKW